MIPQDTTDHAYRKQLEIIMAMTPAQRFMQGIEMIDAVRMLVENSIKAEHPDISEVELKVAVFLRYYQNDYSPEECEKIVAYLRKPLNGPYHF